MNLTSRVSPELYSTNLYGYYEYDSDYEYYFDCYYYYFLPYHYLYYWYYSLQLDSHECQQC